MVQVPTTPRNSVEVQPLDRTPFRYAETRNQVGPAMQQFGEALGRAAVDVDEIEATYDQADVLNGDNTFAAEAADLTSEFKNLKGDAPGRNLQDYLKRLGDRETELVSAARSERARNIMRRTLSVRRSNIEARLTEHSDAEMFKYRDAALAAGRDQAALDAQGAVGTPQFEVAIGTGLTRIEERAKLAGLPDEVVALEKQKFYDEVHGGVLDQMFAAPDPDVDAIGAYLQSRGNEISPALRNDTLARLQGPLQGRVARSDADLVMGFTAPPAPGQQAPATPAAAATPIAVEMLRGFEGFRGSTYWDVNHHRVGYGSDTITDASGKVRRVQQGDRVTQADADRDLQRRATALEQTAAAKAGAGWNNLPAGARAAVISVAYNYGEGSDRLKPLWAAAGRGDANAVADVIAGFAGDNGGINRTRRLEEANTARNGGGYSSTPREWDKAQIYANLEAVAKREGWNPERIERTRAELDKRIQRDEGLLRDHQNEAGDRATEVVQGLGDNFKSTSQIPREIWNHLSPADKIAWQKVAEANSKPVEPQANGQAVMTLNLMRYYEPEKFKGLNLAQYAGHVTRAELDTLLTTQAQMRTKPNAAAGWSPRSGIVTALNYGKKINQLDLKSEDEAAILQIMEADANRRHAANGGKPLTEVDYQDIFKAATREVHTVKSTFGITRDSSIPRYQLSLSNMPASQRARLTAQFKRSMGREPTDDELLRLYRVSQ